MKTDPEYYLPIPDQPNKVLALVRRAASTSMANTIRANLPGPMRDRAKRYKRSEVAQMRKEGYEIVVWIREPFDRLACAYHFIKNGVPRKPQVPPFTIPEFAEIALECDPVELFLQSNTDHHWLPQVMLHTLDGVFLPTKVYSFDDLAETWPIEFPGLELPRINASEDRLTKEEFLGGLSADLWDRLDAFYAEDVKLYNSLTR